MKLGLFTLLLSLPSIFYAQDNKENPTYPNTFSSGSTIVKKFDNEARKFNDWAISIGGGTSLLHHSDLTSFNKDGQNFGWNAYVGLSKQVSDKFALELQYQTGKTKQTGRVLARPEYGLGVATTRYNQLSLLGDVNFSNLFRRTDNNSPYRWAIHGYAGVGVQQYTFIRDDDKPLSTLPDGTQIDENYQKFTQDFGLDSFYFQGGAGFKFNLSKRINLDTRVMYIITGDDEFDGGGETSGDPTNVTLTSPYNQIRRNFSDNLIVANVGLTIKLGKNNTHLAWYDATNRMLARANALASKPVNQDICQRGDKDGDGVCDDWDRELETLSGARVDGSGRALDMDLDGVIDLNDKCVTVPGIAKLDGCPLSAEDTNLRAIEEINNFEGIVFELNKDIIREQSYNKLDNAANVIKSIDDSSIRFYVIGGTDTRSTDTYNFKLSERRAIAVKNYLVNKGVNPDVLIIEARGEKDLKYPECKEARNCPEWKNEANRRVYFIAK